MDEIIEDAAHHLQVYDVDLIYSWTPREYRLLIKGAKHREIDDIERMAVAAMYHRKANNQKRISLKQLFDSDKARKRLDEGDEDYKDSRAFDPTLYHKAKAAMKGYLKSMKGG